MTGKCLVTSCISCLGVFVVELGFTVPAIIRGRNATVHKSLETQLCCSKSIRGNVQRFSLPTSLRSLRITAVVVLSLVPCSEEELRDNKACDHCWLRNDEKESGERTSMLAESYGLDIDVVLRESC